MRLGCVLVLTTWLLHAVYAAGECSGGVFGIAAQVVRIVPVDGALFKRTVDGDDVRIGLDGLICSGDSLQLLAGGPVIKVDLYVRGQRQTLTPPDRFVSSRGGLASASQALTFLADAIGGTASIKAPPEIPGPTATRGASAGPPSPALQIRTMRLLEELPRQNVTPDVMPLLSWREGAAPYACEAVSSEGDVVWKSPQPVTASWCELAPALGRSAQWLVRDARGRTSTWNIRFVERSTLPVPPWLGQRGERLASADHTAWAWWLWKNAGPAWRLQALAMLHEAAPEEWIAGYLRDQVLAESAAYSP
jgi:hypothetical protein